MGSRFNFKKFIMLIAGLLCLLFMFVGFYGYRIKKISPYDFLFGSFAFGFGLIIALIHLTSKTEKWFILQEELNYNQSTWIMMAGFLFAISSFWVAVSSHLNIILRLFLFIVSIYIIIGSIRSFRKKRKKGQSHFI